jgi:hypothetical protein
MGKDNSKGEGHNEFPRDPLGGRSSLSSPHHKTPATTSTADIWENLAALRAAVSAATGNSENRSASTS